jgi:Na/Pi-cotransporter
MIGSALHRTGREGVLVSGIQVLFAIVSAIILFLYALKSFSREIQDAGGTALRSYLARVTSSRVKGFVLGAAATAVLQSSSAVTALAVALVDASVLTFRASLGILLGANVGTTATAWLVSFKLTGIGPVFIVLGAAASAFAGRFRIVGQPLFYFGLIFLTLDLLSAALHPLREQPLVVQWLGYARQPLVGAGLGLGLTAIVQSSSVTTGLVILLVQQGMLPAQAAIPVVIGANIGTTSTGLIASVGMAPVARATAVANFLFNVAGVVLFLPVMARFSQAVVARTPTADAAVAWAHLLFNVTVALVFLVSLRWVEPALARRLGVAVESVPGAPA